MNVKSKPVLTKDLLDARIKREEKRFNFEGLNVGYYVITPLLAGVFLGLLVDNWLKTKPLFTGIFLFFGTIACFYNLLKLLKDGK